VSLDAIPAGGEGGDALRAMAHAIRSPMNVIGAAVQELATAAHDERPTLLAMVTRSVERLGVLAERLDWLAELRSQRAATLVRCDAAELVKRIGREASARGRVRKGLNGRTARRGSLRASGALPARERLRRGPAARAAPAVGERGARRGGR
jgi:signal transduction histidine kinase